MLYDVAINPEKRELIRNQFHLYPKHLEHELMVWLAMPGFSNHYHAAVFDRQPKTIIRWRPQYETYRKDCLANWASATNEDIIKIAELRPKGCAVPLIVQMAALDDLKHMTRAQVRDKYNLSQETTERISERRHPKWSYGLPPEFALIA